ncbi:YppE family protein [Bacillus sp. ISL-51]|uniref:YppE family protein n=1 Tax=Bacteria TaxID=2 RepID=UPI001BE576A3|nr:MULTISPECIES: YppE family protein [Bacteria]MBT2575420.1 YppE family protein [Bacillus sp. ISL-51]MBT2713058.1 YppE family protein [Pseudomonas sp. ISL-88]
MQTQSLLKLTEQMIEAAIEADRRYQDGKEYDRSYDFFETIKPDVEKKDKLCALWIEKALPFIQTSRPKYVHQEQILAVKENFSELMLQSYVHHIHKKRYKDLTESVLYTLRICKDEVEKEGS